jgi:hypothetical protein
VKQAALIAQGLCRACGRGPLATATRCDRCAQVLRDAWQEKYAAKRKRLTAMRPPTKAKASRDASKQITLTRLTRDLYQINDTLGEFDRKVIHRSMARDAHRDALIRRSRDILGLPPGDFRDEGGNWKYYV